MTITARQTDWTCPACYARGTVEHQADATGADVLDLVRASHAIKQPSCIVSRLDQPEQTAPASAADD
jgi:hypothetical protein